MNASLLGALDALRHEFGYGRSNEQALAERLHALKFSVPPDDLPWFVADLMRGFGRRSGEYYVPPVVCDVIPCLLEGHTVKTACDPWAGVGVLAARVHSAVHADRTLACTPNAGDRALGEVLAPQLEWHVASPLDFLAESTQLFDAVVSLLPIGGHLRQEVELKDPTGEPFRFAGDLGHAVLAAASRRLSPEGVGLFVVTHSFFFDEKSIRRDLSRIGIGIQAALSLPAGCFAPYANITTYVLVVQRQVFPKMFVAQLSLDRQTNRQIVGNLREGRADGALELGRLVPPVNFRGLGFVRLAERFRQAEDDFQAPAMRLGELAQAIQLGRSGRGFSFSKTQHALYIPLTGNSDAVESIDEMTIKQQNYAQVVVDVSRSDARFVARFLNSELGRASREANKSGAIIRKLNTTGLKEIMIVVPDLETQKQIMDIEARVESERNTLLGLKNDLASLQRELWSKPTRLAAVESRLKVFSARLAPDAALQTVSTLEEWFETLPFPLASILRAWQATPSDDHKTKYEHVLHFFEAAAEFLGIVLLSAYSSRSEFYSDHRAKLAQVWKEQNLSLERATFGTWKCVVEYFAKQTRTLLSGTPDERTLCAELFDDPSLALPAMLADKKLVTVLSAANKMRNDWTGHGGAVSPTEARLRNEQLLSEVQKLRDAMADRWAQIRLIRAIHCKPRRGMFDNEIAILVGSNSEFIKESCSMQSWLDVERLYLVSGASGRALLLLPLMRIGASPSSAKNACYFFNRIEKDGIRFISYHFIDQPEFRTDAEDATAAISFLTQSEPGAP